MHLERGGRNQRMSGFFLYTVNVTPFSRYHLYIGHDVGGNGIGRGRKLQERERGKE